MAQLKDTTINGTLTVDGKNIKDTITLIENKIKEVQGVLK